jgi:hypothetical protein
MLGERSAMEDGSGTIWKLTVTARRLVWLQKKHPGACGHKLQQWAIEAFKENSRASSGPQL